MGNLEPELKWWEVMTLMSLFVMALLSLAGVASVFYLFEKTEPLLAYGVVIIYGIAFAWLIIYMIGNAPRSA